eukprot:17024-Heterococcus_DN1.PRE.7
MAAVEACHSSSDSVRAVVAALTVLLCDSSRATLILAFPVASNRDNAKPLTINTRAIHKKSSKKSSKKGTPAAEATLISHRAPNLTDLLERAKRGKLCDVQQYLSAGGSANVFVEVLLRQVYDRPLPSVDVLIGDRFDAPLVTCVALAKHSEAATSIQLLLDAGADVDAVVGGAPGVRERTARMLCAISNNLSYVQALLQGGTDQSS